MNATQARSRLLMLAQVMTEESIHHPRHSITRNRLGAASIQLASLARRVDDHRGPVVEAYIAAAIDLVAPIAAARGFGVGDA